MKHTGKRGYGKTLVACCRKLGVPHHGMGLRPMLELIVEATGATRPRRRDDQWKLLRAFCNEAPTPTPSPHIVRPATVRPDKPAIVARRAYGDLNTDPFLSSYEWRSLRMVVLKKYGARCQCCGADASHGIRINVDHIKPRRDFPALALDESNLQVLCEDCNHGKGNWDRTDWRRAERPTPNVDTATVTYAHHQHKEPEPALAQPAPRLVRRK